ncbi:LysR family transcriptional regulator [Leptolinea tardivitalis]|uniref:HTH lysR-type domain-containing protein n=1 Tax=Leptolinea tardivitalis TaxID=229920 RepID=A0A0P6XGH7_9CHLR|nr:LysR family transcriptional regulator [Leptolinea tardivitalis]KPL70191.1 hypothetical protein ADM99_13425 [Leptolinea tardivitalis]GAP21721.1 transcriptional regulator [Leptolinea tardivitalis]
MDLTQLTTFRTIASLGSFSQAADVLGYAQSTVSEQIKNLEMELNTALFKRAGSKRVALTPAGARLLDYAQKMSNLEDEIKSEVTNPDEPHGSFSIRIPETISQFYLPAWMRRFYRRFSKVNLGFMDCVYFDLPEELKAGIVDLGFLILDQFISENLETEILMPVPLVMVTYPENPLLLNSSVDLSQLRDEPLFTPSNDCSYSHLLEKILTEQKVRIPNVWRFNSIEALKKVLMSGIGFTVLPEVTVHQDVQDGRLAVLPWQDGILVSAHLLMIWQKNRWLPPALKAFMDIVRDDLKEKPTP